MRLLKIITSFLTFVVCLSFGASQTFAITPIEGSWTLSGMDGYEIHSLAIDPMDQNTLYVGTSNNGIYKSIDGGLTWIAINNGIPNFAAGYITDIVIDPNNSNTLYAGGVGVNSQNEIGLFKSTDGGMTWSVSNTGFVDVGFGAPPFDVHNIIIDQEDSSIVYVAMGSACGSVYKTVNGGELWTRGIGLPCDPVAVRQDPSNPNILYTGNDQGIFKSTDRGANWNQITSRQTSGGLTIDPFNTNILYSSDFSGIYKSLDYGVTWTLSDGAMTQVYKGLLSDPIRAGTVYSGQNRGVATGANVSSDGGSTWNSMNNGLPAVGVKRLLISPTNTNALYAGTENGLYVYGLQEQNNPPEITMPAEVTVNKDFAYNQDGSFADPDSWSWTASVDYGDGSGLQPFDISGSTFRLSHHYTVYGTYTITLTIQDNQGASTIGQTTVTVNQPTFTAENVDITTTNISFDITNIDPSYVDSHSSFFAIEIWTPSNATRYFSAGGATPNILSQQASCNALLHCEVPIISDGNGVPSTYVIIISSDTLFSGTNGLTSQLLTWPSPITTTFTSSADTYVKSGQDNRNLGAGTYMRLQSSGDNRSLVLFDQTALQQEIGSNPVLSAKLRVTIVDNGNNWGTTGRTIDVHRLIAGWAEGNGTENSRGTGTGATWECALDTNIANQSKDCTGNNVWEMGQPNNPAVHPWIQSPTATQTITNNQTGVIEFDVTADVQAFLSGTSNNGWIIKKTNEGQNGQVSFGTKESVSVPQLVVTYQP